MNNSLFTIIRKNRLNLATKVTQNRNHTQKHPNVYYSYVYQLSHNKPSGACDMPFYKKGVP